MDEKQEAYNDLANQEESGVTTLARKLMEQNEREKHVSKLKQKQLHPRGVLTLCLDFDGVCHSYVSSWQGDTVIPDPPVDGLFEFLAQASQWFDIAIYSTRSKTAEGREAMMEWFGKWYPTHMEAIPIAFPENKPPAYVTLDDRVLTFTGEWPDIETLRNFKPWNK